MPTGRDFDAITVAMNKVAEQMRRTTYKMNKGMRPLYRLQWTRGDRHVERVVQEILAGKPGRPAHIRLIAAQGLAEVLDRG
jgi:hypothetical protein